MISNNNHENLYQQGNGINILVSYDKQVNQFPEHWHLYSEIIYVIDGTLSVNVGGIPYTLTSENILFIAPCELHSILPNQSPQTLLIQYSPSILMQFPSIARHSQTVHHSIKNLSATENPNLFQNIRKLLFEIYELQREYDEHAVDSFCDVKQYMCVCQIVTQLFSYEKEISKPIIEEKPVKSWKTMQSILETCSYISCNYTDNLTLAEIAERAGMSKYYFSRMFEQYTGSHFNTYLARCRLDNAKRLLANKNNKITDIAFQSGFGSLATFNRTFIKYEGMSPTDFRMLNNTD